MTVHRKSQEADLLSIRRRLLRWYDLHRRDLPWRKARDPYRIWVSEVMLQQTRVKAVVPYYETFLRHFPDVETLAAASEEELLACWSGLGYYSRARNLQKAACVILQQHGGKFPPDLGAALALPGIGRYTASAVLSIAYKLPLPVLDGNVARVLSRLYAVAADLKSAGGDKRLRQLADKLISTRRPGDFNQAMMELGATICLPRQPQCEQCPIRGSCMAYLREEVKNYPPLRRKSHPVLRRYIAALVQDGAGRVLLVRRPDETKWLGGFWELPMWEPAEKSGPRWLAVKQRLGTVQHSITDNRLIVAVFLASLRGRRLLADGRWIAARQFRDFPITTVTRKALALAAARHAEQGAAGERVL